MEEQRLAELKANPAKAFASPIDVARDKKLEPSERLDILKSWEQEAQALERALEENMTGGESSQLHKVRQAIDTLCADHDLKECRH